MHDDAVQRRQSFEASSFFKRSVKPLVVNSLVALLSCVITLAGIEASLRIYSILPTVPWPSTIAGTQIPAALIERTEARHRYVSMPDAWKQRLVQIPGASEAYYWQGALHTFDVAGFRRLTPFPDKKPDVYRVMVVGDSLTYGFGIDEKDTFAARLNDRLGSDYRVEVLNLGVPGYESEDVRNAIKKYVPTLKPNLVIYAICLNDFLSSSAQYKGDEYAIPLPDRLTRYLMNHTFTGAFLNDVYDGALRRLHLRPDFLDDILSNFEHDDDRFRDDVAAMNAFVKAAGLPPLVAMVVDQYPDYGGRGYRVAMMAEDAIRAAGAKLIPTTDYYIRYNGKAMYVSRWEGHPDEVANYIWAEMFANELRQRPDLQAFKR
jgi:hypothetical protein